MEIFSFFSKCLCVFQKANAKLQDALYAEKQGAKKAAKNNVDPDDLRKRLDKVVKNIQSGKVIQMRFLVISLTHCGLVMTYCDIDLGKYGL